MVTYKVDAEKATKLRKQLLWANIWAIILMFMMFFFGVGAIAGSTASGIFAGLFAVATVVACIIALVAYWRALWALWEWPGIGVGFLVAIGVVILNTGMAGLGSIASIAFLIYVYIQLGKHTGEQSPPTKREVFNG